MCEPGVERRADWYFEMMKHSYAACSQRRNLVWHLSIALWTVLGLLIVSVLRTEIKDWTSPFVGFLPVAHVMTGLLYLAAVVALQRADKSDSRYANELQCALAKFIANPADGLEVVRLPNMMCWRESGKQALANWAAVVQLVVTVVLLVGSYAAWHKVMS